MPRYQKTDRVNVYLEAEQRSALRTLAAHTGVSESDLVRKAVTYLLRNQDFFVAPVSRDTRVSSPSETLTVGAA